MLTIVILTKNEQGNLPVCLAAIPERYPIVIVDSGSDDDTVAIAASRNCRIYTNPWLGFAEQRNFAINKCDIVTPWLLFIDADEIYPQAFYNWFEAGIANSDALDVLMVPSILYLRGKNYRPHRQAAGISRTHEEESRKHRRADLQRAIAARSRRSRNVARGGLQTRPVACHAGLERRSGFS